MIKAIDRLYDAVNKLRAPVCVGLDPSADLIPEALLTRYGTDIPGAFLEFNKAIIDAVRGIVPCVKPQLAMYERYGAAGISAYFETVKYASSKGLVIIGDMKRNDIGSTALAYADAYLKEDGADFITVNPYLGRDSIEPFMEKCRKHGKGLFILCVTSNPGWSDIQSLQLKNGEQLFERVGDMIAEWGKDTIGECGYSSIGAVVGATAPAQALALRERLPHTLFLIPGYGAQGGTAADAAACFDKTGAGGIVNSSRGIIAAWKKPEYAGASYAESAKEEAVKMINALRDNIYG